MSAMFARLIPVAVATAMVVIAPAARAADPAAARIEAFDRAVVEVMKEGPALGPRGRFRKFQPIVEDAFDLPLMTRYAVGRDWNDMSASDRASLVRAFTRLSAASYAHNFDRYGGERFEVLPNVQTRGPDKVVASRLTPASGAPVSLSYRVQLSGGVWKIVDVYYGAISQLANRRADFAAPLAAGGAKGLEAHLDALVAKLLQ